MSTDPSEFRASHLVHADFLGAFAVLERAQGVLMVQNERVIAGRRQLVWDLPGGQVEPGEMLDEALRRELREETGLDVEGAAFLFLQEGEKIVAGVRRHAWRSFFFAARASGEPVAGSEVGAVRWVPRVELPTLLTAPYHDSFRQWLLHGGSYFRSAWRE